LLGGRARDSATIDEIEHAVEREEGADSHTIAGILTEVRGNNVSLVIPETGSKIRFDTDL